MNFQPILEKIRFWWENSDKTQKLISIVGAVLLVALVGGTAFFATRPKMEPIFPGALPSEQGIVRDAVVGYGYTAEINSRGDVMVPVDKMPEIRMKLSQEGKIPSSAMASSGGPTVSSEPGFFLSPSEQEQRLKAQKEAELAKSIMTLAGVQNALVHISFGKDSPFGEQKVPPAAVVNITEKSGSALTEGEGKAIARLVQNSVPGLLPQHVSVINSQGRIIYDGEEINSEDSVANRKLESEREESRRREKELQKRLDLAFGPGATLAMLQVELNMDEVQVEQNKRTPTENPESRDSMSEELKGAPNDPTSPAGLGSNLPGQPASAPSNAGNKGNYKAETSSEKFATDETKTTTKKAAGQVESISVSVLVDQGKVQDLTAVQDFVNGTLTAAGTRNFRATVVPTTFSTAAETAQKKQSDEAANAQRIQQVMSLLPILALIGVGFMLMKALSKGSQAATVAQQTQLALAGGGALSALPGELVHAHPELALPGQVTLDGHIPSKVAGADGHEHAHELLVDKDPEYDLSKLDQIDVGDFQFAPDEEHHDPHLVNELKDILAKNQYEEEEEDLSPAAIRDIREKVDVPLERIRRLAKERPETVATLLKSWIMEEN